MLTSKSAGFTLIEVMIAVVVLSLVLAWAIPNYQTMVLKSHRKDMQGQMLELAAEQEQYRSLNGVYQAQSSVTSDNGRYNVVVTLSSSLGYLISATATGVQANDSGCTSLSVDGIGNRSPASCWP